MRILNVLVTRHIISLYFTCNRIIAVSFYNEGCSAGAFDFYTTDTDYLLHICFNDYCNNIDVDLQLLFDSCICKTFEDTEASSFPSSRVLVHARRLWFEFKQDRFDSDDSIWSNRVLDEEMEFESPAIYHWTLSRFYGRTKLQKRFDVQ